MLFKLENLSLEFGEKIIFESIDFIFNKGDKIGIVGDNGVGKSSLFNVILDRVNFFGDVIFENKNFGFLGQDEEFIDLKLIDERRIKIEKLLLEPEMISDSSRYDELLLEYSALIDGNSSSIEKELLLKFRFDYELYSKEKKEHLSGGETTKLKLIKLFCREYDYLLLDEPSNHLDRESRNVLVELLLAVESFIVVSHNVELLNKVCNKIVEIKDGKIKSYFGNYDVYLEQREKEDLDVLKVQTEHRNKKEKIQRNIDNIKAWSQQKVRDKSKHLAKGQVLGNMGIGRGSMDSGIISTSKKLNKMFDKIESFDTPEFVASEEIKIKYLNFEKPNKVVLKFLDVCKSLGDFSLSGLDFVVESSDKVSLQGVNGSGKSTILKLIVGELRTDSGLIEIGDRIKIGYLSQKNDGLSLNNLVLDEIFELGLDLKEGEIRKYLGKFLFKGDDVFKKVGSLSGGEKIRLGILKLILSGCNFLVLDEPSNHLDIKSKNVLASALRDFPGAILVVSHDDYFLDVFVNRKIEIKNGELI